MDNNESTPDQILCSQQCEALHKIASKLHQLENGQRKIIQLLLNLDKELTSKEKSGTTHCSKHSRFIQKIYIFTFHKEIYVSWERRLYKSHSILDFFSNTAGSQICCVAQYPKMLNT